MLMTIMYTYHLKDMLTARTFPEDYLKKIYLEAEERYFDILTRSLIAIKKLSHTNKRRKIMIAYFIECEDVIIKTIYAEKDKDIKKRVKNGRWIKI